eukprot:5602664-Alexandrium_andersonii.AAC.1
MATSNPGPLDSRSSRGPQKVASQPSLARPRGPGSLQGLQVELVEQGSVSPPLHVRRGPQSPLFAHARQGSSSDSDG